MDPKTKAEIAEMINAGVKKRLAAMPVRKAPVRKAAAPDPRLVKINRLAKEMQAATSPAVKERLGAEITLERLKLLRSVAEAGR